jgi:hypothetical protein
MIKLIQEIRSTTIILRQLGHGQNRGPLTIRTTELNWIELKAENVCWRLISFYLHKKE